MNPPSQKEIESRRYLSIHLILEGILIGMVVGAVIALFRISITTVGDYVKVQYELAGSSHTQIVLILIFTAIVGLIAAVITRSEPMIGGSGIPQVAAQLVGRLTVNWKTVLPAKFVGGIATLGLGLTMGREGPSVQVGSSVGDGIGELLGRPHTERRYLLTCGAAAGLASAFNAPIAGIVFSLEELHKSFSPTVLVTAMASSFAAVFVEGTVFGVGPVLKFYNFAPLPLKTYGYILILGMLTGLSGVIFNKAILTSKKLYAKVKLPWPVQYALPFIVTALFILYNPALFGSGENFIFLPIDPTNPLPHMLLVLYVLKLILIMVAFGSGLPGGIFFPLLVLGSIVGNAYGQTGAALSLWDKDMILAFSLIAMCGHFSAIVRSPLTGIVLISEMTSSFAFMLPLGLCALTSFLVAELLKSHPIYEDLQDLIPGIDQGNDKKYRVQAQERILVEFGVETNSPIDGMRIADVRWPERLLVVAIRRGTSEIFPHSQIKIQGGDYLICYEPRSDMSANKVHMELLVKEGDNPEAHVTAFGLKPFEDTKED